MNTSSRVVRRGSSLRSPSPKIGHQISNQVVRSVINAGNGEGVAVDRLHPRLGRPVPPPAVGDRSPALLVIPAVADPRSCRAPLWPTTPLVKMTTESHTRSTSSNRCDDSRMSMPNSLPTRLNEGQHVVSLYRIEAVGGLVEQQQVGIVGQGLGHLHPSGADRWTWCRRGGIAPRPSPPATGRRWPARWPPSGAGRGAGQCGAPDRRPAHRQADRGARGHSPTGPAAQARFGRGPPPAR